MFIMLSGLSGAQGKTTVEDKMAETMRSAGVGITITSLTDLVAFFVGSFSSYIAVQNFCIYTGNAIRFSLKRLYKVMFSIFNSSTLIDGFSPIILYTLAFLIEVFLLNIYVLIFFCYYSVNSKLENDFSLKRSPYTV